MSIVRRIDDDNPLSGRERFVLDRLSAGDTLKDVATELGIDHQSVKNLMVRVRNKLGADTSYHAIGIALRNGWID